MSIDVSQFHQVFFEESFEGLDAMEMGLLGLSDGELDSETIDGIFRAAHSIKGGAGTFGFKAVGEFTHALETLLDQIRIGQREISTELVQVCLQSVDVLRTMLKAAQQSTDSDDERIADVSALLHNLLAQTLPADIADVMNGNTDTEAVSPSEAGWKIQFTPYVGMMQTGNDPLRLIRELGELGEMSVRLNDSNLPAFVDLVPEECYLQWDIELRGEIAEADITEIFEWVEGDCDLSIAPLNQSEHEEQPAEAESERQPLQNIQLVNSQHEHEAESATFVELAQPVITKPVVEVSKKTVVADNHNASIRVGTEKVDMLINLVGELVITQSMLSQLGDDFTPQQLPKLLEGLEQLARNTRELQENILRIRMLPISFAFNRFPRLVHDLSSELGKKVELRITGEQTELDKTVLEKVGDPLIHLVRNALDHGLESPEQRIAAGKAETGLLQLTAYHQGGNVVIEISDDGAGLNEEKILHKAIERGLVADNEQLSTENIHELIFQPGFSTATQVSDLSGRGVGMDVVRKNIQQLGGYIEIHSEHGKGTTFRIRLPLTLAIMDGQIIKVASQKYIIPLISIIETVEIKEGAVKKVAGKGELFNLNEEFIPLVRLYQIFNLQPDIERLEDGLLVIVETENGKLGLFIDDLLAQQQIVIKSLETNYRNVAGLAGATILGDGMVALILDVSGLMNLYQQSAGQNKPSSIAAA